MGITPDYETKSSYSIRVRTTDSGGLYYEEEFTITITDVLPTVNSVNVPTAANYIAGQNLDFTVNFSEAVTVNTGGGTPYVPITLDTGGTVNASYVSGTGTTSLVFRYTVISGNLDTNGIVVGSSINANGGTLKDSIGNDATLTLNGVGDTAGVLVDAVAPAVSSVNVPAVGSYRADQNLDFIVNFNEAVTVNTTGGTPYISITLDTGGTVNASYVSGSGTTALVFRYTVASGNSDTNGIAVGSAIVANGGTIKDSAGNDATLTLNSLGSTNGVLVDAVAPAVSSVSVPANDTYVAGENLDFTVNFSEAVTVDTSGGTPYIPITLDTGGTVNASYVSGSGTTALVFRYTVASGNSDTNGIAVGSAIVANGGTIKDSAGNDATLTLNSLGSTNGVLVDAVAPAVSSVLVPASDSNKAGQNLDFTVNFSEAVTVDTSGGTPYIPITLDTGGTVNAYYVSGTGTTALVFRYTIAAGNNDADGIAVGASITANGGTLKDSAGNNANLTLNSIGSTAGVLVDTTAPTVGTVSVPASDTYIAGEDLDFTVNYSEAVTVNTGEGVPFMQITLDTGGTLNASYVSGSGTTALVFRYTVAAGNNDPDGIAAGASITANEGTLKDSAGNDATLALNGVGNTEGVLVDAVEPAVSSVNVPAAATYVAGQNLDFTVNFSEAVTVNTGGGTPFIPITLDTGGTVNAGYVSGAGSTALVFRNTVAAGNNDADGITVGASITANGGSLKDSAGNDANLTLNSIGSTAGVMADALAPTVTSVTVPAGGSYGTGQELDFTVNFSENVVVDTSGGTPCLQLTVGTAAGNAGYISGSGSSALLFRYTIQPADRGDITVGTLEANGATIKDAAGNDADLTLSNIGDTANISVSKDITLTSPNGGETWAAGSSQTISWDYSGSPGGAVKIELLKDGVLDQVISYGAYTGNDCNGSCIWPVPASQAAGSNYTVRVTSILEDIYTDTSNSTFTIIGLQATSITVSAPNGGETWAAGSSQTISWDYSGSPGDLVKVELLKSGAAAKVINTGAYIGLNGSGSCQWTVPAGLTLGTAYKVRVTSTINNIYTDTSNNAFTITGPVAPTITVSAPLGGESWAAGSSQTIRWSYTGNAGYLVKIELLKSGALNRVITYGALIGSGGRGTYQWTIPSGLTPGADYKVRVTSFSNSAYTDTSDAVFSITPKP